MNYEEHVREIAERKVFTFYKTKVAMPSTIEMFKDSARSIVEYAAEAVRTAMIGLGQPPDFINNYLIDHGLIPSLTCKICSRVLVTDNTGTYCKNGDCSEFWQDQNKEK